jgi:hypothetical protein
MAGGGRLAYIHYVWITDQETCSPAQIHEANINVLADNVYIEGTVLESY